MFPRGNHLVLRNGVGEKNICIAAMLWIDGCICFCNSRGPPISYGHRLMPGNERNTTTAGPAARAYAEAVADGV